MNKIEILGIALLVVLFGIAIYYYPLVPAEVPAHWNAEGEIDGYMSAFWGIFLAPLIGAFCLVLMYVIPRAYPLKSNMKLFWGWYVGFIAVMMIFFIALEIFIIFSAIGEEELQIFYLMCPLFCMVFVYAGLMMRASKRNWAPGIKNPWTLASDEVWEKVNKHVGKLFIVSGFICLLGLVFTSLAIWFVIAPIIAVAVYSFYYSWKVGNKVVLAQEKNKK